MSLETEFAIPTTTPTVLDYDDPQFQELIPGERDVEKEMQHNPAAKMLHAAGLETKRDRLLSCRRWVWKAECAEHGVQKTYILGCGGRWCANCVQDIVRATLVRFGDMLRGVPELPGNVVLVNLEHKLPKTLDPGNFDFLRGWIRKTIGQLAFQVDNYLTGQPKETYFRSVHVHGVTETHLVSSVFVATAHAEHKHKWRALFPEASKAWVDRSGTYACLPFFERHVTPLKVPYHSQLHGANEILFSGMRLLRAPHLRSGRFAELSVVEEKPLLADNSDLDPQATPENTVQGADRRVFHCPKCNRECKTWLEDRTKQLLREGVFNPNG